MTCDLKMTLAFAAEKSIRPLVDLVSKLARHLTEIQKRAADETENLTKARDDVARWKTLAGDYLGDSPGAFDRYKTSLKRALARLETAQEAVKIFASDLVPHATQELVEAREKLAQAFTTTCATARADCEASMAEKLGAIVAEYDAFMAAIADLGKDFGTAYHGKPPVIYSPRLDEVRHTLTGRRWLTFLHAPAVAVPAAPVPAATGPAAAVPARPVSAESTATAAVGESATGGGPLPPEAAVVRQTEAADPLGARARVLLRSSATETPEAAPADLDPYPLPPDPDTLALDGPDLTDADDQGAVDDDLDGPDDLGAEAEVPSADG